MQRKETVTDEGTIIHYSWKTFECEICKQSYPYEFKYKNRKYNLTDCVAEDVPK